MLLCATPAQPIEFDVKPYLDYRVRYERRTNRDLYSPKNDNRTDFLNRFRVGFEMKSGKHWSGELQYQFATDESYKISSTTNVQASDVNLAFARYKDSRVELTMGRQKINIGSERLIGSLEWSMTGRAFDGFRVKEGSWDAYAFKVAVALPKPERTRIAGTAYTSHYGLSSLIFKHDDALNPSTDHWTLSHLWTGKWGKWSADGEGALQVGHTSGKNLRAWAFHAGGAYAFAKSTRGFMELNAASGGSNGTTSFTFDNLLPTNHKFYGSMDLQSWRNMTEIEFGIEHQLNPRVNLKGSWHSFALRDASDAWYGAGGAPNQGANGVFKDPTGASGRDLGREIDFDVTYKQDAHISVSGGFGLFSPGGFVKVRNGGHGDNQKWMYLMVQLRF